MLSWLILPLQNQELRNFSNFVNTLRVHSRKHSRRSKFAQSRGERNEDRLFLQEGRRRLKVALLLPPKIRSGTSILTFELVSQQKFPAVISAW